MTETDEQYLVDRLDEALERNDQQAFERALKNGDCPSTPGELEWNIVRPVLRWGRGWAVDVLFEQVDWSAFDRTREDFVTRAIEEGAQNLYERAAKFGCGMAAPISTAVEHDREDVARLFGTAPSVTLNTGDTEGLKNLAGTLAANPDLLEDLIADEHFRHESTKGQTTDTNLMSMILTYADEHHPAHTKAFMSLSAPPRKKLLQGLLRARPPEWLHQQFRGYDVAYHKGVEGLCKRAAYKENSDRLIGLIKEGAGAAAVVEALRDGATAFYPGSLKRAPVRTIIEAYSDETLRTVLRTLCEQTDYPLNAYFSQRYPLVRIAILADERTAFDFFHDRYDRTDADVNNIAYSLMSSHKFHYLADFRDAHDERDFDELTLSDAQAESALKTVRGHPESFARILPMVRRVSSRRSALYGYARTLSVDKFMPILKAVDERDALENMKSHYDRSGAGAFLAMRYETVETLLEQRATVRGILNQLLDLETSAQKAKHPGRYTNVNLIDRHTHMLLNFFRQYVRPEDNLAELYELVAGAILDDSSDTVLVNFFEQLRALDGSAETLDGVYRALAEHSKEYPRFVRFLVRWQKPSMNVAETLATINEYRQVLGEELNRRELNALNIEP